MIAHPSIQDLSSEAELITHDTSPLAIAGYRRQMTFRIPGARRQDWVLGTMGFALHRDANFSRFKLILVEIATTRLIQRRVISYRLLVKVKILGETSVKETVLQQTLLPAALSFSLIGLSHEPGALGIIIYPRKGSVRFS